MLWRKELMIMKKFSIPVVALAFLLAIPAMAQDDNEDNNDTDALDLFDEAEERTKLGWVKFYASVGGAYLDADGTITATPDSNDPVTIIDFDRAGLKETDSTYWLAFNWRSANSRWGAWFGSWRYDVTGSRIWKDELVLPDKDPIPIGASVTSEFDAKWYILEATYSFYRSETVDSGIGFGLHTVDLDTTMTARIELADESGQVVSERLDTLAPLPNILGYLHWKFAPRWSFVGRYGWFGLDYKDYSGKMTNAHAMVNFEISPRWALALGYQFVNLDLKDAQEGYVLDYSIDFSGPLAYLRFNF
jgi:hypothetical protein